MVSRRITNEIEFVSGFLDSRYPVNPEHICNELGIKVKYDRPLDKDGYLICKDGKKIILISSYITNRHRRNFIIAHELGHFLLHREQLYSCDRISEDADQNVNNLIQEQEANAFATELLIPRKELTEHIPIGPLTFTNVFDIANEFDISVTHAAIQAVMASNSESEILICYDSQRRKWYTSANGYTHPNMIPSQCPVYLPTAKSEMDITGAWAKLYTGSVHQEIFNPYRNLYLVLLSGHRK